METVKARPTTQVVASAPTVQRRYQALLRENWVPLATIVSVDQKSPYYNEKNKAGGLYNEGWALTHMLELSAEYAPRFQDLVMQIRPSIRDDPRRCNWVATSAPAPVSGQ